MNSSSKKLLDIWHQALWCIRVMEELDHIAISVDKILGKVPLNLRLRQGLVEELVELVLAVANDIALCEHRELYTVVGSKPLFNLGLGPGLFRCKLVAGDANDQKASRTMRVIQLLVIGIVRGEASDGRHVDEDDGLGIASHFSEGNFA